MNEELRIHVERVVRPIRASFDRKMRMREELWSLISDIHAEESARTADADAALQSTLRRFGEPNSLRKELQASVGWFETTANRFAAFWERGENESLPRHALRVAVAQVVLLGLCTASAEVVLLVRDGGLSGPQLRTLVAVAGMIFIDTFVLLLMGELCCRSFVPHQWTVWNQPRLWLAAVASAVVITLAGVGLVVAAGGTWPEILRTARHFSLGSPVVILLFVAVVQLLLNERRRAYPWQRLELN